MTTVPTPTLGATGYVEPAEADVLTAVLNDINTAFGGGLNVSSPNALSTPQGQLASSVSAITTDMYDMFLNFVNQVDPLYAQGVMQDAIGLLYFQRRIPAVATAGPCTCTGLPGTVIPSNAQATDGTYTYVCSDGGTIPDSGSVTLTFASTVTGAIPCVAGSLSKILQAVPGWSGVVNPADLVEGRAVESAQDFELRRQNSVASNALGVVPAVYAAVVSSGISLSPPQAPSSVFVAENYGDNTTTISGVSMPAHSIYVAVLGGDPQSIGKAILNSNSAGCTMVGNTDVIVQDTSLPWAPTYHVSYEVPAPLPLYFYVQLRSTPNLPADINTLVKNAIIAAFATPNQTFGAIAATTNASDLYPVVAAISPSVRIISIGVGTTPYPNGDSVTSTAAQYPSVASDGSSIAVGVM